MTSVAASRVLTKAELCLMESVPMPCALVIFGASGDLAFRKLYPSLYYLERESLLPKKYFAIGVARSPMSDAEFRSKVRKSLPAGGGADEFLARFSYLSGDYSDPAAFARLKDALASRDAALGIKVPRRLFYLSTPPSVGPQVAAGLGAAGLSRPCVPEGWARIVVEKPFGADLASARRLNADLAASFAESQIYRIDHYLGKETVQNILVLRFANSLFEPAWNRNHIDSVQITAAEALGVEHRAGYYDGTGVVRDMFQNHLLQVMSLVAMDPPSRFDADRVRSAKFNVLQSIRPLRAAESADWGVRGQYGAGEVDGVPVCSYQDEEGIPPGSTTPTYAALRLEVDNWRWQGVPFYLRAGKRMARRATEVAIRFKHVPVSIFKPLLAENLSSNVLRLRIQPQEGVAIGFEAKHPGPKLCISTVTMDFDYQKTFGTEPPESYARLLQDALAGDQTLFTRSDEIEAAWSLLAPALEAWADGRGLESYPAGSWGPEAADALLAKEGRGWLLP